VSGELWLMAGMVLGSAITLFTIHFGVKVGRQITKPQVTSVTKPTLVREKGEPVIESNIFEEAMRGNTKPVGETGERNT
jgi:hypothetical protein